MSLFKQRKNRKFNLQSRFSDIKANSGKFFFSDKWEETRDTNIKRKKSASLGILFVLLVLLIYTMYLIDKKYL